MRHLRTFGSSLFYGFDGREHLILISRNLWRNIYDLRFGFSGNMNDDPARVIDTDCLNIAFRTCDNSRRCRRAVDCGKQAGHAPVVVFQHHGVLPINPCIGHQFLSNEVEKNLNKYLEDKRQKSIEEKQQLKSICHKKYSYNQKVKHLLNCKNQDEKENINDKEHENENLISSKMNYIMNSKGNQKGSQLFNNIWLNKNLEKKHFRQIKKSCSSLIFIRNRQTSKTQLPLLSKLQKQTDLYKLNSNIDHKNERFSSESKKNKVEKRKKVSFFVPRINSINSDNNLKLHLCLYHAFKEFGEAYSENVIKNIKKV